MQKEEFPTFLNEQPTIIFGRTARELMIIAGGSTVALFIWNNLTPIQGTAGGAILTIVLIAFVMLLSVVVALVSIAGRPLEEWLFILLYYVGMPKLFLYMPLDEEEDEQQQKEQKKKKKPAAVVVDPYDEDASEN